MIIFLNEDRAYRYWVTHHRLGFVLDGHRRPRIRGLTLHRADCSEVKATTTARRHATTGHRLRACSLDRHELETWAIEESGNPAGMCPVCHPAEERAAEPVHLSRLSREILEYILEAAMIHMEHEHPPYRLTIGDIAACFAKTPGQLGPALRDLVDQGMIVMPAPKKGSVASPSQIVFPTVAALRTLDGFRDEPELLLERELRRLTGEAEELGVTDE